MDETIEIDGSFGSGGGQIIRTSVGLSALTGKPCRIFNIRSGRPEPGLKPQHLCGVDAVAKLCNAKTKGIFAGSNEIVFSPGEIKPKELKIDVGTAGSITLVLQSLMIPAVKSHEPLRFEITGGTHVRWSPTTGYFRHVFSEFMKKMGLEIMSETVAYGYYPRGGGKVNASLESPGKIKPVVIEEQGKYVETNAWSNASRKLIKAGVAERQIAGAEGIIAVEKKNIKYVPSLSDGSSITIASSFENCVLGSCSLGERGKPAERVGGEAAQELKQAVQTRATVDKHMSDQILPYMAIARGTSAVVAPVLTAHAKTNMWTIQKFLGVEFDVKEIIGGVRISCRGASF